MHNIYIDSGLGETVVIHGRTGQYELINALELNYIKAFSLPSAPPDPIVLLKKNEISGFPPGVLPERVELFLKKGFLTRNSREEEKNMIKTQAENLQARILASSPTYAFMPSYHCNFECMYCFQEEMRKAMSKEEKNKVMSRETADRIFASFAEIEKISGMPIQEDLLRRYILYGGEPLLKKNLDVVDHITAKARALSPSDIRVLTNGYSAEHFLHLMRDNRFNEVQISLDGTASVHDTRRPLNSGGPTFEKIAENISKVLDTGAELKVRVTIDKENFKNMRELTAYIEKQNWNSYSNFKVSAELLHAGNDALDHSTFLNQKSLRDQIDQLREDDPLGKIILNEEDFNTRMIYGAIQKREPLTSRMRPTYCSAHNTMYIFDPLGDIYSCWERTGDAKWRTGFIDENSKPHFNEQVLNFWRKRVVTNVPECASCSYALFCAGGCGIHIECMGKDYMSPNCNGFPEFFKGAAQKAVQYIKNGNAPVEWSQVQQGCQCGGAGER